MVSSLEVHTEGNAKESLARVEFGIFVSLTAIEPIREPCCGLVQPTSHPQIRISKANFSAVVSFSSSKLKQCGIVLVLTACRPRAGSLLCACRLGCGRNGAPSAVGRAGLRQYFQNYEMVLKHVSSLNYALFILVSPEESNQQKETDFIS